MEWNESRGGERGPGRARSAERNLEACGTEQGRGCGLSSRGIVALGKCRHSNGAAQMSVHLLVLPWPGILNDASNSRSSLNKCKTLSSCFKELLQLLLITDTRTHARTHPTYTYISFKSTPPYHFSLRTHCLPYVGQALAPPVPESDADAYTWRHRCVRRGSARRAEVVPAGRGCSARSWPLWQHVCTLKPRIRGEQRGPEVAETMERSALACRPSLLKPARHSASGRV